MNQTALRRFGEELARCAPPAPLLRDPARLREYAGDAGSPVAAVFPESRAQVQEIVRAAGRWGVPLAPVSSGPGHARGAAFGCPGPVVVDFSGMKKIHKIDAESRYAWIEAGVTFGELIPELRKAGLRLNQPFLPRASKSVAASLLEREPVLIPKYQYDGIDPLLTVEVIYGTGDDFRTGSASGPGPLEQLKADKVNPWGPGSIDYVRFLTGAQGTMGFVTWVITKTELMPKLQKLHLVAAGELKTLTDLTNRLLRKRVIDECLIMNHVNLAALLAGGDAKAFNELRAGLPRWTLAFCISGFDRYPEERAAIMETYFGESCRELGIDPGKGLGALAGYEGTILGYLSGCWDGAEHWKRRIYSGCRDILFLSPPSRTADLEKTMAAAAVRSGFPADRLGATIQPQVQGRSCHSEYSLYFDAADPLETAVSEVLFTDASRALMDGGAYFSRPYGSWADMVYDGYAEGAAALRTLKSIFDPLNILNPGKLCFLEARDGQP